MLKNKEMSDHVSFHKQEKEDILYIGKPPDFIRKVLDLTEETLEPVRLYRRQDLDRLVDTVAGPISTRTSIDGTVAIATPAKEQRNEQRIQHRLLHPRAHERRECRAPPEMRERPVLRELYALLRRHHVGEIRVPLRSVLAWTSTQLGGMPSDLERCGAGLAFPAQTLTFER
jgi:hypothetical protein